MTRRQHYFASAHLALTLVLGVAIGCTADPTGSEGSDSSTTGQGSPAAAPAGAGGRGAELEDSRRVVLFLGDSLSAGYGLRSDETFPARIQARIDDEALPFRVVNAGVSGDTTAGGLRRIDWLLRQPVDTLIIQLGGNDMLRGLDLEAMRSNLRGIAEKTRTAYPESAIVVTGMQAAPNLGPSYVQRYQASFEELASELDAAYIPFLLEGVAARHQLNQSDGIHPTAEGHAIVAETVWSVLAPVLRARH